TVRREGYGLVRLSDYAKAQRQALGKPPTPPIAVVTGSLQLDWSKKLFTHAPEYAPTTVITAASVDPERLAEAKRHAPVIIAVRHVMADEHTLFLRYEVTREEA